MRIREITEDVLGDLMTSDFRIVVDSHAMDRAIQRDVLPTDVDRVIKKLSGIRPELAEIPLGQQFWVYDNALEVAVGFRRLADRRLLLKTVLGKRPWTGTIPILNV